MVNYSLKNIDFARQSLMQKIGRPPAAMAIYPLNIASTTLSIQIVNNSSVIGFSYNSGAGLTIESVSFVGKSLSQVVTEINSLGFPLRAVALCEIDILQQGDFISLGPNYIELPGSFSLYDRFSNNSVLLRTKKFFVKHNSVSKIKLLTPYFEDSILPWYPRITNGSFTEVYDDKIYHYYIAEFDDQTWSPIYGKPFKTLFSVVPTKLDSGVYKLPRSPIYWDGSNITIFNEDIPLSSSIIQDVDVNNGIIYLNLNNDFSENIKVNYTYLEKSFVYDKVNLNAHFSQNPALLDTYVVIYIVPIEGTSPGQKRTVFHSIGNSIKEAIDSIIVENRNVPYTIIGAYSIQQVYSSDKVQLFDTRTLGGGLRLANGPVSPVHYLEKALNQDLVELEDIYPQTASFWDIGNYDGEAYPGAAAVSVDFPFTLKEKISEQEIKLKTQKFIAAGVYPHISFSNRDLPAVSGLSSQVSCAINLDFKDKIEPSGSTKIYESIPEEVLGNGWIEEKTYNTDSVIVGSDSEFNYSLDVRETNSQNSIVVDFPIKQSYLKSSPFAGISWKERTVILNQGDTVNPVQQSMWEEKTMYDYKQVDYGQLNKNEFILDPEGSIKEYKDIRIHCPYHYTGDLHTTISNTIYEIVDKISNLKDNDFNKKYRYTDIETLEVTKEQDYLFNTLSDEYLFDLCKTSLSGQHTTLAKNVADNLLENGLTTSGLYLKYYIQNANEYNVALPDIIYTFKLTNQLDTLNKAIAFKKSIGEEDSLYTKGLNCSSGLLTIMLSGIDSEWKCIPTDWGYYLNTNYMSGIPVETPYELGGTPTDIHTSYNKDWKYCSSLPGIFSILETEVDLSDSLKEKIEEAYSLIDASVILDISNKLNAARTSEGYIEATTSWAFDQTRYSTFLGNTLANLTKSFDYLLNNLERKDSSEIYSTYLGVDFLHEMFIDIEHILNTAYDVTSLLTTRSSVVGVDIVYTLKAYAWYVNRFDRVYGITGKLYLNNFKDKFKKLAIDGSKVIIKSHFNSVGSVLETTFVAQEPGPFILNTPTKVFSLFNELLVLDSSFYNILFGLINTVNTQYYVDGLYYKDPLKRNNSSGPESEILKHLVNIQKTIDQTDTAGYVPINENLDGLIGTNYYPIYSDYRTSPPVSGWPNYVNSLGMWKYYDSGAIESELSILKDYGVNTVRVQLDYHIWKEDSTHFFETLDHFIDTAADIKLRVVPVLLNDSSNTVEDSSVYYSGTSYLSGEYSSTVHLTSMFYTGGHSGEAYVSGVVTRYTDNPCILGWDICNNTQSTEESMIVLNGIAHILPNFTDKPTFISFDKINTDTNITPRTAPSKPLGYGLSVYTYSDDAYYNTPISYNPNYDVLCFSMDPTFIKFIDIYSGNIMNTNKKCIINNLGNSTYGDYSNAISGSYTREFPYFLSNVLITDRDGTDVGMLYEDRKVRSSRQLDTLQFFGNTSEEVSQELTFENRIFFRDNYIPAYTSFNLIRELASWENRKETSVEKERDKLNAVQSALDTLNYRMYPGKYIPELLTVQECDQLIYYKNQSLNEYSVSFNTLWGKVLYNICKRLGING